MEKLVVRDTPLGTGLRQLVTKFEQRVQPNTKLVLLLAGGMAVHLWVGKRVTSDVDAEFSTRVFVPPDLIVDVPQEDGSTIPLYFDTNYNSTFALMHEDYAADSVPTDIATDKVELRVLTPVDLAVSKIARFLDVDREDIESLVLFRRQIWKSAPLKH